jgi:hypothetical protein
MMRQENGLINSDRLIGVYNYGSWTEFAKAHPVQAVGIASVIRKTTAVLPDLTFLDPEIVAASAVCSKCGKTKPVHEFPPCDKDPSGIHHDCCECRKKYCKSHQGTMCMASPRKPECDDCEVGVKQECGTI